MPKQCPDCATYTADDIGYCPACACSLTRDTASRIGKLWQALAMLVASASIAGATVFYFWRESGR